MFIEPLDPRRLMATTGLDPTFGAAGTITLPKAFSLGNSRATDLEVNSVAAGNGATFVAAFNGLAKYVIKIGAGGQIDPRFGDGGYARVPYEAVQLACDTASGSVYVGATDGGPGGNFSAVKVTRLKANGRVDKAFGVRGTFTYQPPPSAAPGQRATAEVVRINPLRDGSAVLAVDRSTFVAAEDPDADPFIAQSLSLIKLRPNGTRDVRYGRRGFVQVLDGTVGPSLQFGGGLDGSLRVRRGTFADVRTDRNGDTQVLIAYADGSALQSQFELFPSDVANVGRFEIKARTVSPAGKVDAASAYSWKLLETGATNADAEYAVRYAGPEGDEVRAVVSESNTKRGTTYLYTLRRGERPTRRVLAPDGVRPLFDLTRSADGRYLASDGDRVVRLRGNFTRDNTFADRGVATASVSLGFGNSMSDGVYVDDRGRVLAFEDPRVLERFD